MSASPTLFQRFFPTTLLDRYVLKQLALGLTGITTGAIALIWLMQSLRFVSLVVDRGLSLRVFLELTGLMIPSFLAVILPITTFLVILFGYQRMTSDRETTVMQAAGLSASQMARPGVICATIATVLCYLLNLWIVPTSYHSFKKYQFEIRNRLAAYLIQEGVFTPLSKDMTVYVRSKDRNGQLRGIFVEDDRLPQSHATILAEYGSMIVVDDVPHVVLYNGSRQEIDKHNGRLDVLTFKRNLIDLTSKNHPARQPRDAGEMSISELLNPENASVSPRDRGKFAVEAWKRLTSPLTALSYGMVALFTVLSGAFSRHGNIKRPFTAILTVVALIALNLLLQNLTSRNLQLVPLMWLVAGLPAALCAGLLFGPELRQRLRPRLS